MNIHDDRTTLSKNEVAGSFMDAARDRAEKVREEEYGPPAIDHTDIFEELMDFFEWYKKKDAIAGAQARCAVRDMARIYAFNYKEYKNDTAG